jgi:hypothetical protein
LNSRPPSRIARFQLHRKRFVAGLDDATAFHDGT